MPAEVRLYNPLFLRPDPNAADFAADLNPQSLEVIADARVEPALAGEAKFRRCRAVRAAGYFCRDPDSTPDRLVFNRTVGLRDSWAKVARPAESERRAWLGGRAAPPSSRRRESS